MTVAATLSPAAAIQVLAPTVCYLRGSREGDALADLLALAFPEAPPFPNDGFGDPFPAIAGSIEAIIDGWERVGRLNLPGATAFRDRARVLRQLVDQVNPEGVR